MGRILSLDKMLDDLRGAAAADNAKAGFAQGFQQGKVDAAASEVAKASERQSFDQKHPGVATSYLTDQGRTNYDKNDQARKGQEAGAAAGAAAEQSRVHAGPTPSNYDEMSQAYFKTLADMSAMEQGGPGESRPDLAALDAAQRGQGGMVMQPGTAMPPQGAVPPPAPAAAGIGGLTAEQLAALDDAARRAQVP